MTFSWFWQEGGEREENKVERLQFSLLYLAISLNRKRLSSKGKKNIDLYDFFQHTSISQRTPFLLHLLRLMGIFIALALFLSNLHHLQQDSGIRVISLDFGMDLEIYLATLYRFSMGLVIVGLSILLACIFGCGKEVLLVRNWFLDSFRLYYLNWMLPVTYANLICNLQVVRNLIVASTCQSCLKIRLLAIDVRRGFWKK